MDWRALEPPEAVRLMLGYEGPWWIGGGWALDLFVGRKTREHADLDVAVLRADQREVRRHFGGWDLHVAHEGRLTEWSGEWLDLPRHTLWARPDPSAPWELELLLMEADTDEWRFRRDPRITLGLERIGCEREGVPFLTPEIPLLYKATEPREQDEADFTAVVDLLPPDGRRWLVEALRSFDPTHGWLDALDPK